MACVIFHKRTLLFVRAWTANKFRFISIFSLAFHASSRTCFAVTNVLWAIGKAVPMINGSSVPTSTTRRKCHDDVLTFVKSEASLSNILLAARANRREAFPEFMPPSTTPVWCQNYGGERTGCDGRRLPALVRRGRNVTSVMPHPERTTHAWNSVVRGLRQAKQGGALTSDGENTEGKWWFGDWFDAVTARWQMPLLILRMGRRSKNFRRVARALATSDRRFWRNEGI